MTDEDGQPGSRTARSDLWLVLGTLAALSALAVSRPAVAADPQATLCAKILLRALAYDAALPERAKPEVVIAVLGAESSPPSLAEQQQMFDAFSALGSATVRKLPLRIVRIRYVDGAGFAAAAKNEKVSVVYLPESMTFAIKGLVSAAKSMPLVLMTRGAANAEAGIALAVAFNGDKPMLLVNTKASAASGMRIDSDLLAVAKVIQ